MDVVTLDAVVADPHLHALYLQHLSTVDKKSFARLLFLVSVEEFKKVFADKLSEEDPETDAQAHRRQYASKIITKFMSPDAFLNIASENLRILNKSVGSFGKLLRNDLMLYSGLAAKTDLFQDAEVAVKKALQPSFKKFAATPEFAALVASSRLTYVENEESSEEEEDRSPGSVESLASSSVRRHRTATTFLTLERVLGNRRLCSVFWVFLFKERTHEQLSLWMDFKYQLLPVLEDFIHATQVESEEDDKQENDQQSESEVQQPGELIEQLLVIGSRIAAKYLTASASTRVTFVGEAEQALLRDYELRVACCLDAGSFSLADAEVLLRTVERIQGVIEADLKVNHFVRFMGSESFKSLVASYQSRLLSPSGSSNAITSASCDDDSSTASNSSMTTLQELFQCMNVASHQPQRVRSKSFTLRDLFQGQLRGEPQSKSLISSVLSFRLDVNDRSRPEIVKEVLHTLADPNNHSDNSSDLYHHHAIPDHVEAFFRPSGADVVRSTSRPDPSLFHMTIGNADKAFYGACLTRYVPLNDSSKLGPLEQVLQETEGLEVYVPAGICVISRYPILDTLKQRLDSLHASMQDDEAYLSDANWLPSAAQMAGLLCPFDFAAATASHDDVTSLSALDKYVDFSMEELFSCLSVEHVVALVTCMLLERQIVLVSSRYSVLTAVGETLKSLIAPLEWSHVFAPILPKSMLECLQCPTPYLFGVHSSYRVELREMLEREGCGDGIVVVDLDSDTMSSPGRPQLPESVRGPLTSRLLQLLKPKVFFSDSVPMLSNKADVSLVRSFPQRHVRTCFREAMATLLRTVEEFRFVLSDDFDYVVVFDRIAFLRRLPPREQSFYRSFLETQVFSHEIASVDI